MRQTSNMLEKCSLHLKQRPHFQNFIFTFFLCISTPTILTSLENLHFPKIFSVTFSSSVPANFFWSSCNTRSNNATHGSFSLYANGILAKPAVPHKASHAFFKPTNLRSRWTAAKVVALCTDSLLEQMRELVSSAALSHLIAYYR